MPGDSGGTPQRSIRGFWNAHKKDPPTSPERKAERAAAEARQRKIAQEKALAAEKAKELGFHDWKKHKGGGRPTFDSIWKQGSQSFILAVVQERDSPPTRYETECPKSFKPAGCSTEAACLAAVASWYADGREPETAETSNMYDLWCVRS